MRDADLIANMLFEGKTEICNASIWACLHVAPVQVFNLLMGGVALVGLVVIIPTLLLMDKHK